MSNPNGTPPCPNCGYRGNHQCSGRSGRGTTARPGSECYVFSATGKLPAVINEVIDRGAQVIIVRDIALWGETTYYVSGSALNAKVERAAGRLGAMPVVMPEGKDWLSAKIRQRRAEHRPSYLFVARRVGDDGKDKP